MKQTTKMTTRRDVIMARMKQLQEELKLANEFNKKLLQEQEESEQEIERVVRTNTSLKNQLANQDVEYEDLQGQRDELQAVVERFQHCQEIHEQALQRIRDLEQQLQESDSKRYCKYCSGNSAPAENNLNPSSGYPVCMDSPAPARRRPAAPHSPALRAALAAPGSPALRALFAPRPSPAPAPAPAPSPRREPEPAARRPVPPSPAVAAPAPSPPSLLRLALERLTVEPEPRSPAPTPSSLLRLALERLTVEPEPRPPAPSPARASSAAPAPAPGAPRARSRDPPRSTVIYSDAIGAGLGVLLGECLRQSVTNVCLRGASVESVVRRLARDKFDSGTTLIIHLGDSVGVKRSHVGSLIRTLSDIERHGIYKIILCSFPYSDSVSHEHNVRVSELNSMLYNATCYESAYHFIDLNIMYKRNNYRFRLRDNYLNVPRNCKVTTAKLLAYNVEPGFFDISASGNGAGRAASAGACAASPRAAHSI
ncbi:eukaryotic translation initiation factor 3 subunit A-like [Leguminivora glycinivorella]|uniref:eukaryotic translation initiation factor 3 subunit A-like n=1 Tax=Leguminivora glycinivorella TaxID=1035111 RepID=UPI00201003BC|nr:eukaryotic translation initiation factor 3 subunit A-like [Leguminivora glycinivorella]